MIAKIKLWPNKHLGREIEIHNKLIKPYLILEGKIIGIKIVGLGVNIGGKERKIKMYNIENIGWVPEESIEKLIE